MRAEANPVPDDSPAPAGECFRTGRARRTARGAAGLALTELLLALPALCLVILAVSRIGQSQGVLVPAHLAARYAAWSEAAAASAPPAAPVPSALAADAERAAHAPRGAHVAVDTLPSSEGGWAARRAAPAHAEVIVPDLAMAGWARSSARVREDVRAGARPFPAAEAASSAVVPVGLGRPRRPGWMPELGEGAGRLWSRAFAGP